MTARITAAPTLIKFVDGTTYKFSPLTDRDLDELDEWLQFKIIDIARRSLPPTATKAEREETLSIAQREACSITFLSPRGVEMMSTLAGMVHLCFISVVKAHPEVTEETFGTLLRNPDNLRVVNEAFTRVNQPAEGHVLEKGGTPREKKVRKRSKPTK
jgi:hypothetical protein